MPTDPHGPTLPANQRQQPAGGKLGRYQVIGELGSGGAGLVLEVRDPQLGRQLAAKVIKGQVDATAQQRFIREAQLTGRLEHPNIVPVHELGQADGQVFFTMKQVRGEDLARLLERVSAPGGSIPLIELLQIFLKICDGMAFAHSQGVIHRDLKPANIMVGPYGEVLVMDWGLGKQISESEQPTPAGEAADRALLETLDGVLKGTPAYMPPEQARGELAQLDARADIYALGAILYQMLTLEPPFTGDSLWDILVQVRSGTLVPPGERAPERQIPWELEAVVLKAMALKADDRYPTALALRSEVTRFLEGQPLSAARYRSWQLLAKWAGRHKALTTAAGLLLAMVVGLASWGVAVELGQRRTFRSFSAQAHAAYVQDDWARALRYADRATALRADPTLARMIARCSQQIEKQSHYRQLQARLKESRRLVGELRMIFYSPASVDISSKRDQVKRVMTELDALGRSDRFGDYAEVHSLLGVGRFYLGQDKRAETALKRALALTPEDDYVRYHLARIYLDRARTARMVVRRQAPTARIRAETDTRRALALLAGRKRQAEVNGIDHDIAHAWQVMAALDQPKLLVLCREMIARHKGRLGVEQFWLLLALKGKPAGMLAAFDEAIRLRPHFPNALVGRGYLHHRRRRFERAAADYTRAMRINPQQSTPYYNRGISLYDLRRYRQALSDFAHAARLRPRFLSAYSWRSRAHGALGQHKAALADMDRCVQLSPGTAWLYLNRGRVQEALGDSQAALADFRKALSLSPKMPEAHDAIGTLLLLQGDRHGALAAVTRAIKLAPNKPKPYNNRGAIKLQLKDIDGALADFSRAIKLDPHFGDAYSNRGSVRNARGDLKGALADMDRAIKYAPYRAECWGNRSMVRLRTGDIKGALADSQRALELDDGQWQIWGNRGLALANSGRKQEALRHLRKALQLAPQKIKPGIAAKIRMVQQMK